MLRRETTHLRLPGVFFSPAPPAGSMALPPLDVAAFVGFAERGPLHLPVAIEDASMYAAVFGGDLPLARDEHGRTVFAHLPSAVRTFFANGGRRCYVVRVAGEEASAAQFVVPGMVAIASNGSISPAVVAASSPGRWGSGLRLASRLMSTSLPVGDFQIDGPQRLAWDMDTSLQTVQRGDLLRLTFADGRLWLFAVATVQSTDIAGQPALLNAASVWEVLATLEGPPWPNVTQTQHVAPDGAQTLAASATLTSDEQGVALQLEGADALHVGPGDLLEIATDDERRYLLRAEILRWLAGETASDGPQVEIRGGELLRLPAGELPHESSPELERVERLRFDLLLQQGTTRRLTAEDMAFLHDHPRFWGNIVLLASSPLTRQAASRTAATQPTEPTEQQPAIRAANLFRALQSGKPARDSQGEGLDITALAGILAPLALDETADATATAATFLPLAMPPLVSDDDFVGQQTAGDDDLAQHHAAPFLDSYLKSLGSGSSFGSRLLDEALDRYYVQERSLQGMHSLLVISEAALLAVPDAVHRPWQPGTVLPPGDLPPAVLAPAQKSTASADTSSFVACQRAPIVERVEPDHGTNAGGTLVVVHGSGFAAPGSVEVRFADRPATGVTIENDTTLRCVTPSNSLEGFVAVAVTTSYGTGTRADAFVYQPESSVPELPTQEPETVFDLAASPLLEIQQAVVHICQARGDMLGILTLPAHFETAECTNWLQHLRRGLGLPARRSGAAEMAGMVDLSYAAVYHPWLLVLDEQAPDRLRAVPCDGAVAGMIAQREQQRQVWVAPANVPLQGVLGLKPAFSSDEWAALFAQQINLLRPEPRDFRALSAHTLSDARALLQISVRRLLMLLRKVAIAQGTDFVFESNHELFREGVRAMLNSMLRSLFERGAFAGAAPEQAYRVITNESVNPPQSIEQGRFVVHIQVAPSQPAEFINVTLIRTDGGLVQAAEG